MPSRRYFILDDPLPGTEIESMMGRIVLSVTSPLFKYMPKEPFDKNEPRHDTQDILPSILPDPLPSGNRKDVLGRLYTAALMTKFSKWFGIDVATSSDEIATIVSKKVERYTLKNDDLVFNKLMEDDYDGGRSYSAQLREFLESKDAGGTAYMVSGFLTTENTSWTRSLGESLDANAHAEIPLEETTGIPNTNFSVAGGVTSDIFQSSTEKTKDKMIFAVQYDIIRLKYRRDESAKIGMSKQPAFSGMKRAGKRQLALGNTDASTASRLVNNTHQTETEDQRRMNKEDEQEPFKVVPGRQSSGASAQLALDIYPTVLSDDDYQKLNAECILEVDELEESDLDVGEEDDPNGMNDVD